MNNYLYTENKYLFMDLPIIKLEDMFIIIFKRDGFTSSVQSNNLKGIRTIQANSHQNQEV